MCFPHFFGGILSLPVLGQSPTSMLSAVAVVQTAAAFGCSCFSLLRVDSESELDLSLSGTHAGLQGDAGKGG